jgi:hypothetical protein
MDLKVFENLILAEKTEIIRAFNNDLIPPIISVKDINSLMKVESLNGQNLIKLGGVRSGNAFIWTYNNVHSFWVKSTYSNYRKAYKKFLNQVFGYNKEIQEGYDIDHLFNQKRGLKDTHGYLRVFPIKSNINRKHGSGFEKRVTNSEKNRILKPMHFMTFISYLKIIEELPPKNSLDTFEISRIVDKIHALGYSPKKQIYVSLINLIERNNNPVDIVISSINMHNNE